MFVQGRGGSAQRSAHSGITNSARACNKVILLSSGMYSFGNFIRFQLILLQCMPVQGRRFMRHRSLAYKAARQHAVRHALPPGVFSRGFTLKG